MVGTLTRSKWADERLFFRHQTIWPYVPFGNTRFPPINSSCTDQYPSLALLNRLRVNTIHIDYRSIRQLTMTYPPSI